MAYPTVDGVKLFSSTRGTRKYPITKITIHHMAGVMSAASCYSVLENKKCSCDYMVDKDAKVWRGLDDKYASVCSSNSDNDHRAITIEVSNSKNGDPWPISDAVYNRLVQLVVELCKCYDIKQLNFTGDKNGSVTLHKMFAATACPGPNLEQAIPKLVTEVNSKLMSYEPLSKEPVRVKMGYASHGDIKSIEALLNVKSIPFTTADGYVTTDVAVSSGDQVSLVQLCAELGVPCVIHEEPAAPVEPGGQCELLAALEKENAELKERVAELEADKTILENRVALRDEEIVKLNEKIASAQAALA